MSRLPPILRGPWRILQARRAILRGRPEEALDHLRDPCLSLSARADWIRSRTLEILCRTAALRAAAGRDASSARLFEMVRSEDPERAERWQSRASGAPLPSRVSDETLRRLLAEMRAESQDRATAGSARTPPPGVRAGAVPRRPIPGSRSDLAHLAVDDGGESLVASGTAFVLGHVRSRVADLAFLADVEREHARLSRVESFHGGARWCVEGIGRGAVEVDGRAPAAGPCPLADGQEVRLARNLAFRFRSPDPSSSSAVLELAHGAECLGAGRVLLLVPGEGGRVRFGPGRDRHVAVGSLAQDLELVRDGASLVLRSAAGLRRLGSIGEERELRVAWPLDAALDAILGAPAAGRPPHGVALRPVRPTDPDAPLPASSAEERP